MEGVSRVVHDKERNLYEALHPKVIKELPKLEEVLNLFHFLLHDVRSFSGSDVRLGYFFSTRHDMRDQVGFVERYATEYSRNLYTRRTWAIVAYPLEEEARFTPKDSLRYHMGTTLTTDQWKCICFGERTPDPLFFNRPAPKNHSSENSVFFFSRDPLSADEEYLQDISRRRNLLVIPVMSI